MYRGKCRSVDKGSPGRLRGVVKSVSTRRFTLASQMSDITPDAPYLRQDRTMKNIQFEDMLARLRQDAGQRTFGQIVQEREWAYREIVTLRSRLDRLCMTTTETGPRTPSNAEAMHGPARVLLRLSHICEVLGVSRSTVYALMKHGQFPASVKIGPRAVRWRMIDLLAWQSKLSQNT